ncbi:MAG: hypothetical protein H6581_03190 [Bacteroidia bacterium]|nr:hypothetical protein [Bacteroidia bacterium]
MAFGADFGGKRVDLSIDYQIRFREVEHKSNSHQISEWLLGQVLGEKGRFYQMSIK